MIMLARQVKSSFEYHGALVPAGCGVTVSPIFHAYDEKRFPNPTEFRPERWDDDRSLSLPFFGGGPHVCPGQTYALTLIRAALLHICTAYRVILASSGPLPKMNFLRNRRPHEPIMMLLEPK
jgi:cytochrome P450